MHESIPANRSPLNQAARAKLLEARESAAPGSLYLLQLATWGLEQLTFEEHKNLKYLLELSLGDLWQMPPERAMARWYPDVELHEEVAGTLSDLSPLQAARSVLEDLALETELT